MKAMCYGTYPKEIKAYFLLFYRPVSELSIPFGVNAFCYSDKSNIFVTGKIIN